MILLLDQDGPLADFDLKVFNEAAKNNWHLPYGPEDIRDHRFLHEGFLDPDHKYLLWELIDTTPWFSDLPVVPGSQEGIEELAEFFEVWICTKPLESNPSCRDDKGSWLAQHYGEKWLDRLIIAPDKSMIKGNILLDDAPKPKWFSRAEWQPVVFNAPFNGPGTKWGDLPHWTWGDPIKDLIKYAKGKV